MAIFSIKCNHSKHLLNKELATYFAGLVLIKINWFYQVIKSIDFLFKNHDFFYLFDYFDLFDFFIIKCFIANIS